MPVYIVNRSLGAPGTIWTRLLPSALVLLFILNNRVPNCDSCGGRGKAERQEWWPVKSRNAPDSEIPFACDSSSQPAQEMENDIENRCGGRAEQKRSQADMKNVHCGCRPINTWLLGVKKIDSYHGLFLLSFGFGCGEFCCCANTEKRWWIYEAGNGETSPVSSWRHN